MFFFPGKVCLTALLTPLPGAVEVSLGFGFQRTGDLFLPPQLRLNVAYADAHAATWQPAVDGHRYYTGIDGNIGSSQYYYLPTPDE